MLAIRLKRVGRTNDPSFRIIVQDHRRSPKRTRGVVEYVGSYDARKGKPQVNAERIKYWISMGAQPSDTVHNILIDTKVVAGKKVNAMNKKSKPVVEALKEEPKKVVAVAPTPVVSVPAPSTDKAVEEIVAQAPVEEKVVTPALETTPTPETLVETTLVEEPVVVDETPDVSEEVASEEKKPVS